MRYYVKYRKVPAKSAAQKTQSAAASSQNPDNKAFGGKQSGKAIAKAELRSMLPVAALCNGIILIICLIWAFAGAEAQWMTRLIQTVVGLILGNLLSAGYFYTLGWSADIILSGKKQQSAKRRAQIAYLLRYSALLAVLIAALLLKIAALLPLIAPLFFPKLHYFLSALRQPPGKSTKK
jgi:hypothetical protein